MENDWPINPSYPASFKFAKEQFIYFLNRFCHFYVWIARKVGFNKYPDDDGIDNLFQIVGDEVLI